MSKSFMMLVFSLVACAGVFAQDRALSSDPWVYFDGVTLSEDVPEPSEVLGHRIGERFTRHADLVRYCRAIAEESDRVVMREYGKTHEGRSLQILTISSPENLADLDSILRRNRALADVAGDVTGDVTGDGASEEEIAGIIESNPAIAWLSYNVHGNEASCSEAAMRVLYTLAAGEGEAIDAILKSTVVVIDPLINPDGRDRYVNWYNSVVGVEPNASHDASEHHEPWPGGRTNHYYFDLNRDWLWLVHPESAQRIDVYREYMPQLHIDYHEQGFRSPYFFGLGDDPYNTNIPQETKEWVGLYGKANAEVFDREGLVYATKERFDYLYPGYGKVLPVYHGAVGMLTEQAGHGFAGLAVEISEHYDLTLLERARHHFLTSMSYLETTAANREEQLRRFRRFFTGTIDLAREEPETFFIMADNDPHVLKKVFDLCTKHGIRIERLRESVSAAGVMGYRDGRELELDVLPAGTWVVRSHQAMGRLARALFERQTEVTEADTYDITSWSLPVSFGLNAAFGAGAFDLASDVVESYEVEVGEIGEGDVAFVVDAKQFVLPQVIGEAQRRGMFCRMAGEDIVLEGRRFAKGSLIVHLLRNQHVDVEEFARVCRERIGAEVVRVATGFTDEGPVLGANANRIMDLPRIALVRGEPLSSYSYGQHWHLMDVAQPLPYTAVDVDRLGGADLDAYNVLVLPDGARFDDDVEGALRDWVRGGGTIVASGAAASWASTELLSLSPVDDEDDRPEPSELTWSERDARGVEDRVPGAMMRIGVDVSHPLAAGCRDWFGVIKRNMRRLPVSETGEVIARYDGSIGGVISDRNLATLEGSAFMTRHRLGRGSVICLADDVTIRGFLHGPMRLLMNAIVYGASL